MTVLHLLSGGAAQGLIGQLADQVKAHCDCSIEGEFGAVGLMKERLLAGQPCDLVILTQALIEQLSASGHLLAGSARAVGVVRTGVAVKSGQGQPRLDSAQDLKAALLAADGIYFPDPVKATAGIHFMKVLKSLGLDVELAARLHAFANGNAAMTAMANASAGNLIGCTQVTEILFTPGVELVAALPKEFELATVYTAAVCQAAAQPQAAADLIRILTSLEAAGLRQSVGFEDR